VSTVVATRPALLGLLAQVRPQVQFDLDGPDGNAYAVMGRLHAALKAVARAADYPAAVREQAWDMLYEELTQEDYGYLLTVVDRYVTSQVIIQGRLVTKPLARAYRELLGEYENEYENEDECDV
jgi:hypothetical protein